MGGLTSSIGQRRLSFFLLLGLVVAMLFPAAPAHAFCAPVQVLDSRGSGETGFSPPGEAFIESLASRIPLGLLASWENPYRAVSIPTHLPSYHNSVVQGENLLTGEIGDLRTRCGLASQVVLVGYSQGGQVSGNVLSSISQAQRQAIAGTVLFGDPRYNHLSFADQSRLPRDGILGARSEFPADTRGRVLSYCHAHDPFCQSLSSVSTAAHKDYDRFGEPQAAAADLAPELDLARSQAFEIAVVGSENYRVGAWSFGDTWISSSAPGDVSLQDADAKFGADDHCQLDQFRDDATSSWPAFGLSAEFLTYGGFSSPNGTACSEKNQVQVDHLTMTGPYWHTDRGLTVGDSQGRLRSLYPSAVPVSGGWGLHQRHLPWDTGYVPDLTAMVKNGVVNGFVVSADAEGD